jgi:hypothetical protein
MLPLRVGYNLVQLIASLHLEILSTCPAHVGQGQLRYAPYYDNVTPVCSSRNVVPDHMVTLLSAIS